MTENEKNETDNGGYIDSEGTLADRPDDADVPEIPAPITKVNVDVDAMLNEVTQSMENPSPDLVTESVETVEADVDVYTDASGAIWDNSVHSTGADGKPIYTAKGFFRKRRSYAGRGESTASTDDLAAKKVAEYSAVAFSQVGVAIFGEEWQPIINDNENEKEFLTGAFSDFYREKGIVDIPAGLALCIALGGYSIRRIGKPQTKTKLGKVKEWFTAKVARIRYGKTPKQVKI